VIIYVGFPVAFVWTVFSFLKLKEPAILITVTTIISVPILLVAVFVNTMCATLSEIKYKNRNDATTIVKRHYDCGATDSGPMSYTYHKVTPVTPLFNIVKEVDITSIDKDLWADIEGDVSTGDYYEKAAKKKAAADKAAADKVAGEKSVAK
jgi:hypothetical protein